MSEKTTLIAALRNEGPFLLEWIAYHRVLGFDDILLYSDQSIDGTGDLLAALALGGAITHFDNPGDGGHRHRAYKKAFALPQVAQSDWVMVMDTDEFLNIHTGAGRLPDLLAEMPGADVISLTWRLFGHAGITEFEDAPVLTRFVQAAPADMAVSDRQFGLKTLFRPAVACGIGPHRPVMRDTQTPDNTQWVNGAGADMATSLIKSGWKATPDTAGYRHAQINHYVVRSAQMFALQNLHSPPLGSEPTPLTLADYITMNTNHDTDQTILRHADAVAAETARLRALPGVAAAHDACVQHTRALLDTMLQIHALEPDSPVMQVCDRSAAKQLLHDQQNQLARARAPAKQAPEAPSTTVIDTSDVAPRWLSDLRRSDFRKGWYQSDETFAVQFTHRSSDVLVVSFDNLSNVSDPSLARETWGYSFYAAEGWSHLGVMAFEKNWYRDDALFDLIEAQQSLFSQYKTVVMTGTSMGAYAATAFADLAPGCTVVAFSPQATLDKARVPWEKRFNSGRKRDWSGRYANGPDHCKQASDVFIIYDPYFEPDRRHAQMYQGPNIRHLKSWYSSHKSAQFMRRAGILKAVMLEAVAGTLTTARYYKLSRSRRDLVWYYNGLADHLLLRGHTRLASQLADHLVTLDRPGMAQAIRKKL